MEHNTEYITKIPEEEPTPYIPTIWEPGVIFTDRELCLINNCQMYAINNPSGLPGHNLMIIIDKCDQLIGLMAAKLSNEDLAEIARSFDEEPLEP